MNDRNAIDRVRHGSLIVLTFFGCIAATLAIAAEPAAKPRVLVDFANTKAYKLHQADAETALVSPDGGHVADPPRRTSVGRQFLQITTAAKATYPSVLIEPHDGKWDLSDFDAVEMDVRNPEDLPLRVALNVNNPGADGRQHCNSDLINVAAHDKGTLTVPFGRWFGDPGHPLDLTKIVAVQVVLDKPGHARKFVVGEIRAVHFDRTAMETVFADPFYKQMKPVFGRGMNLGSALEAPHEGDWGVTLKESYFEQIGAAGFDSVRIPVRWSTHADEAAPYKIDPQFFDRVDWAVKQALKQRLIPIVNMHHYEELFDDPDKHRDRFLGLWSQIAEHYKDYPPTLVFELLNEPHGNLTADRWNRLTAAALGVVRRTNPTRQIMVGPIGWNGIPDLPTLQLPEDDRNLVVSVHYYSPLHFTHQGAGWIGPEAMKWLGTKWTGTKAEQQEISRDLDAAIAWGVKHHRPMHLGEFGTFNQADMDSRVRWTRFVAQECWNRKMGYAYWEFCASFAAYDPQKDEWIEPIKEAILAPKSRDASK